METEVDRSLPFLNVKIINMDWKVGFDIHRKTTYTQ